MSGINRLIFVCTGNICRSPMAEWMLKHELGGNSGWEVDSAGLCAGYGMPASDHAVEALAEAGIALEEHRSKPLSHQMVCDADMLVVMTGAHKEVMMSVFPDSQGKTYLIKSFDSKADDPDVEDPIGLSMDSYRLIRNQIARALPGLIDFMRGGRSKKEGSE